MQTNLKGFWQKIKGFFAKLNKKTRTLLGVCAGVILVLIIAAALWFNHGKNDYASLCNGLTASETSSVINFLSENGVTDYRISGDKILVPANRVDQLQLQLVTSNLLNTGFLYESYKDGTNSFSTESERREYLRIATEEKLAAMIRQFDGVRDAQVKIELGETRNYVLQSEPTRSTVAVTITPEGNRQLSSGVVEAIRYTVSHSVKELQDSDVSIVGTDGSIYNDTGSGVDAMSEANALQQSYQQSTNNRVREQVLNVLKPIYGLENVYVSVDTRVDMNRKVVESTQYAQPTGSVEGGGLIGEEHWFWEYGPAGNVAVGGTVGAGPNSDVITYPNIEGTLGNNTDIAAASGDRFHNIDTTVSQWEVLAGTITDISVAVTINRNSPNAESATIEQLTRQVAVASGIGTSVENWDSHVSILIAPFSDTVPSGEPSEPGDTTFIPGVPNWVVLAALAGVVLFLILLILILVLRSRSKKKKLAAQLAAEAEQRALEEAAAAAEAAAIIAAAPTGGADIMEVNTEKSMELRKTVRQFAQNNPEIAAQMVRAWLKGDESGG